MNAVWRLANSLNLDEAPFSGSKICRLLSSFLDLESVFCTEKVLFFFFLTELLYVSINAATVASYGVKSYYT